MIIMHGGEKEPFNTADGNVNQYIGISMELLQKSKSENITWPSCTMLCYILLGLKISML